MKGDANVYDKDFIKTELGIHIFGVYALKFIKHSYKIKNILLCNIMGKKTGIDNILFAQWQYGKDGAVHCRGVEKRGC
jgi:hypothetical protein